MNIISTTTGAKCHNIENHNYNNMDMKNTSFVESRLAELSLPERSRRVEASDCRSVEVSSCRIQTLSIGKKLSIVNCTLLIVFCLLVGGKAWGASLTVYGDNTTTNEYVPIYGWWSDSKSKCEFIIPATKIGAMNGGTISAMKFYLSSSGTNAQISATFQVFVKEVSATTLSAYTGTNGATTVNIYLKRLVSLVRLGKVTVNFDNTSLEGANFTIQQIYLRNAVGKSLIGMTANSSSAAEAATAFPVVLPSTNFNNSSCWYNFGAIQDTVLLG